MAVIVVNRDEGNKKNFSTLGGIPREDSDFQMINVGSAGLVFLEG